MRFEFVDEPFEVTAAEQNRNTIIMLKSLFGNNYIERNLQKLRQKAEDKTLSEIAGVDDGC